MSSIVTEFGRDWVVDRIIQGDEYSEQQYIAVGTGTTDPTEDDIELEEQVYSASFEDANANLYSIDEAAGIYRADITVSGGIEVDPGTEISEFGILTENQDLVYRETRDPTTIGPGGRISFELEVEFINTQ